MDLTQLLDWSYLFRAYTTERLSILFLILLGGFCLAIIVAAILSQRQISKNPGVRKVLFKKIVVFGWTIGLVGLLLIVFRELRALYLGSRLWLVLWLLSALAWMIYLAIYNFKTIPKLKKQREANLEFNKWLPKAKK